MKEQFKKAIMANLGYSVIWNSDLEKILNALLKVAGRKININKQR